MKTIKFQRLFNPFVFYRTIVALVLVCFVFHGCEKDGISYDTKSTIEELSNNSPQLLSNNPDIKIINGVLCFSSTKVFNEVLHFIENSETNYYKWLSQFGGFETAKSLHDMANYKIEIAKSQKEAENIINSYKATFDYSKDTGLEYPFFAHSLAGVLNSKGLVKIEGVLYKFTKNEQIIILDGDIEKLANFLETRDSSSIEIIVLGANKSSNWGELLYGEKTNDGNNRRLRSSLELLSIYTPIYSYSVHIGWKVGFHLKQTAYQQAKSWGIWHKGTTKFTLYDGSYSLWYPLDGEGYSNSELYKQEECKDFTFTFERVEYIGDVYAQIERPTIHSVFSRIISRGVGSSKVIEFNYSDF